MPAKMAKCYLVCALFVCLNIFVVQGSLHVKGLLCQDPDTRKLYPINSTWPSESFCGNYTCRLRHKNFTQTEYAPVTKKNDTLLEDKDTSISNDMVNSPSDQAFVLIKKVQPVQQPIFHTETMKRINTKTDDYKSEDTDTDRYLTESEIKSITEILHTVKKSDLDAIVEIYNIAQDIYKEIDTNDEEKKIKDTYLDTIKRNENNFNKKLSNKAKHSVSYWYEPLHQGGMKVNPTDLKVEGTNAVPATMSYSNPASYFQGLLTDRDFKKLPYYYPMSNFQRSSSYVHTTASQNLPNYAPHHAKACRKKFNNIAPTWVNTHNINVKSEPGKHQMMQPMLLPYPFAYVQHYNFSTYPASFYYSNYPWAQLDAYRNENYPQQNFGTYITQVPNTAVVDNVEEIKQKSDVQNLKSEKIMDTTDKAEQLNLPEWQTEQLSPKVIEEVKANILEDSKVHKPLNIVKTVKLEKVGKVIKLDELIRSKRDVNNIDNKDFELEIIQYEPYIEKTTCESSIEPGFFRLGNLDEPYPACCPQKIRS